MANWIDDSKARARFWARCKEMGYDHDAVHAALNVTSLKEFKGTEAEAIATLTGLTIKDAKKEVAEYTAAPLTPEAPPAPPDEPPAALAAPADSDLAAAYSLSCCDLPEAPAVAWTKFQTQGGFVWSVTVRAGLPELLEAQALKSVARQIKLFEVGALANGWQPIADGRDMTLGLKPRAEAPAPANGGSKPATPPLAAGTPPQAQQGNGTLTFTADRLVGNRAKGKNYWRVKGGKFQQHGVMIWDEVLAASGFDPNALDVDQEYGLPGYIATYILNENNNPAKVIKLELAAQ